MPPQMSRMRETFESAKKSPVKTVFSFTLAVFVFLTIWQLQGASHYFQIQRDLNGKNCSFDYPVPNDTDRAQWAVLTDEARENGTWRVKFDAQDNYPYGTDIYWSSSLVWMGRISSAVWAWWHGVPESTHTVYWGGMLIAPILSVLGGTIIFFIGAIVFGIIPGLLLSAVVTIAPRTEWYSGAGAWDHHGIILITSCIFIVSTYQAVLKINEKGCSSRWFSVSGVSCAVGNWLGVLSFAPTFGAVFAGVAIAGIFLGKRGLAGFGKGGFVWMATFAVSSIVFYLLEFPDGKVHLRAEASNLTVILSSLGAGLFLEGVIRKANGNKKNLPLILGAGMGLVYPLVIIVGGDTFYSPANPEFSRFLDVVHECRPVLPSVFAFYAPLWVAGCIAGAVVSKRCSTQPANFIIIVASLLLFGLGFLGFRWWNSGTLCLGILVASSLSQGAWVKQIHDPKLWLTCMWILFGVLGTFSERMGKTPEADLASFEVGERMKKVSLAIANDAKIRNINPSEMVVLAPPNDSNYLSYFLKCRTICKMSWESFPGILKWATAMGTNDIRVLEELCSQSSVDYVVADPTMNHAMIYTLYGRQGLLSKPRYLTHEFAEGKVPKWIEELPVKLDAGVKIFRVNKNLLKEAVGKPKEEAETSQEE